MSDVKEEYGDEYQWQEKRDINDYGPVCYGEIIYWQDDDHDSENDELPPVAYDRIPYDEWTVTISLRVQGIDRIYWDSYLNRINGPLPLYQVGNAKSYLTLLYKVITSDALHHQFDMFVNNLFYGYLRWMSSEVVTDMLVTDPLLNNIRDIGCYYISAPLYKYKLIELDEHGYFWYQHGNESESSEEE